MIEPKRTRFPRLSPSMIVACLALLVASSGVGYAAATLPRNSVGTTQLKSNAVVSAKVKDRSLKAVDFAAGQVPQGPAGPAGASGATGSQGPAGPAGPTTLNTIRSSGFVNGANAQDGGGATCPANQYATGGGVLTQSETPGVQNLNSSFPVKVGTPLPPAPNAWQAYVDNTSAAELSFVVYVICAPATSVSSNYATPARP